MATKQQLTARHAGAMKLATHEERDYSSLRYDYGQIADEHRQRVQDAAVDILAHGRRAKESIVAMGERLIEVKNLLPHGQFGDWLETEFALSDRMARNYMNVAREFGGKTEIISVLSDTALYLLAAPDVPTSAREQIEAQALIDGRSPKVEQVKAVIAQHRGVEPSQEEFLGVEELRRWVNDWIAGHLSKDTDTLLYRLRTIVDGHDNEALDRMVGYLKRVRNIENYRQEDLAEALRAEYQKRLDAKAERDAKRGPEPPSEWKIREAIEAWLKGKASKPETQHALISELRDQEDKHPDYAEMVATLPAHWRKRELNRAISSLADILSYEIGSDEWETVQLPSGRWYAKNKARNPDSTTIFDTEREALEAVERASDSNSRLYARLETVIDDPTEFWGIDEFFRDAPVDVIAEAKLALDKLAAQPDAPPYVEKRLKRIEARMEAAQRLLQMTTVQLTAPIAPMRTPGQDYIEAVINQPEPAPPPTDDENATWSHGAITLDRDLSDAEFEDYAAAHEVVGVGDDTGAPSVSAATVTLTRSTAEKLHAALLVGAMRFDLDTAALTELKKALKEALEE